MLKELTAATFAIALALPAFAGDAMDADGDGLVSAEEFSAAHPEAAEGTFEAVDANADGSLDEAEITAAKEAGTLMSDS